MATSKWIRGLEVAAAIATLVVFVDAYFLKGPLASSLRLPPAVPIGLFFILIFASSVIILVLSDRITRGATGAADISNALAILKREHENLNEEHARARLDSQKLGERLKLAEQQLATFRERSVRLASIRKEIIAVLTARSRSEHELQQALKLNSQEEKAMLREILGELAVLGMVQRKSNAVDDYEIGQITSA